jgi:hypothetical protein
VTAWSNAALTAQGLATVYRDGSGLTREDVLRVDPDAAATIAAAYALGDVALRRLAPEQTPVLWPEHFDLGITVEEVNYGVSPGDDHVPVPYAYVGPWAPPAPDGFWNASFGHGVRSPTSAGRTRSSRSSWRAAPASADDVQASSGTLRWA